MSPLTNNNNRAEIVWKQDIDETIRISALNSVGLSSPMSDDIIMKLDNTGPITTFKKWNSNPNSWTNTNSLKIEYSAIDSLSGVARYEYTHDDVKAKPAENIKYIDAKNSVELTFLESNINQYVYVRAVDKLGNIGPWTQNPSYLNMDTIAPNPPIINISSNNSTNVKVGFTFKDNKHPITKKESGFGKFEYKVNTDAIQTITKEKDVFSLTTPGNYTVEAWSFDKAGNKSAKASDKSIKVIPSTVVATEVKLNKTNISLNSNQTETLVATISPKNTTNKTITWTTSNSEVASVSTSGTVKGISTGTAIITATIDGKKVTSTVTVKVLASSVSLNKTVLNQEKGQSETLVATISPNNTTNKTITWTTNKPEIATVSNSGVVKGVSAGTAIITATIDGKTATTTVTISVSSKEEGPIIPSGNINLKSETATLKYYRVSKNNVYLTYIWMKDPYNQVKKLESNVSIYKKLYTDDELNAAGLRPRRASLRSMAEAYASFGKIPAGKSFVAFNASGFYVTGSWEPPSPYYNNRSDSWFVMTDGKIIRNRYNIDPVPNRTIIGFDKNNNIKLYKYVKGSEARAEVVNQVLDSGIQNTFGFNPIMLYEGVFNEARKSDGQIAHRQMICQLNNNNFIMLTTINKKTLYNAAKMLQELGCKTIMNLDGGGSTQLVYRKTGSKSIVKDVCRDGSDGKTCRSIVEGMYFIEQ